MKMLKPGREIYDEVVRCTGFLPEEILFVDDSIANVEGARAAGLNAVLKTFLDGDADADNLSPCLIDQFHESFKSRSARQEIIHNQYLLTFGKIFCGDENIVPALVCKRVDLGTELVPGDIDTLSLLGEQKRDAETQGGRTGDCDSACFSSTIKNKNNI